jgi:acetylornithine deacetylase/succinyl-diaminopimelate desuccinylase-like protein
MTTTAKLLRELIALPSVNPAFLPANDACAGEARVAEFLAATAAAAGLDVVFQKVTKDRSNLLVRCSPNGPIRQRVLLAPHMDTVGGNEPRLFKPRTAGDRLFGRGACDTKGSVATMLSALMDLAHQPKRPAQTEIILAALVDEEYSQAGSRSLTRSGLRADLAIVGEPTRLQVVTAHKGVLWLKLRTIGKAAHGARPELGKNAVHEMARIVDALGTDYATQLGKRQHPLLGRPTVNVGAIHGGHQPNIVPAECTALVDRRMLPGEVDGQTIRAIKAFLGKRGLQPEIRRTQNVACPALETDATLLLVKHFFNLARQKEPSGVDYFSDAGVLAAGGIPSILFGPGDIAQAHTPDEWISLRQLESARDLLLRFLQSLP